MTPGEFVLELLRCGVIGLPAALDAAAILDGLGPSWGTPLSAARAVLGSGRGGGAETHASDERHPGICRGEGGTP